MFSGRVREDNDIRLPLRPREFSSCNDREPLSPRCCVCVAIIDGETCQRGRRCNKEPTNKAISAARAIRCSHMRSRYLASRCNSLHDCGYVKPILSRNSEMCLDLCALRRAHNEDLRYAGEKCDSSSISCFRPADLLSLPLSRRSLILKRIGTTSAERRS